MYRQTLVKHSQHALNIPKSCPPSIRFPNKRSYSDWQSGSTRSSSFSPMTLVMICVPIVTFGLGTWQVKRLNWKVDLIRDLNEKLQKEPMRLPERVDTAAIPEFAYRKVGMNGYFDTSKEILLGPRTRDGALGYYLISPFIRTDYTYGPANENAILVNRGFIKRELADPSVRPQSAKTGEKHVTGLLRSQESRGMFTPSNSPEKGEWQFSDIQQMAQHLGTQAVLVDQLYEGNAGEMKSRLSEGIPIGRTASIELRNMHATYALTWYSLSAITSFMLWRLLRKPPLRTSASWRRSAMS